MPAPVISVAQMRDWERATWATGQTEAEVIRRVGIALSRVALRLTRSADRILILAGKGHNGEDAIHSRDHLKDRAVEVFRAQGAPGEIEKLSPLLSARPALIIDGLFGIGLNRPLSDEWIGLIERINDSGIAVLAVDVPSGLNADTGEPQGAAIKASITLTVGAPKTGMLQPAAWPFVGRLEVAQDVGLIACLHTSDLNWTLPDDFIGYPPRRPVASHKGSFGHLAIVSGSRGYHGAAVLAARGAQRAQPGLITLFTFDVTYHPIASQLQAVMVSPSLPELVLPDTCTAILIGPGLGAADLPDQLRKITRRLWAEAPVPVIVDASALDWLTTGGVPPDSIRVLTPHPGEAGRLLKSSSQHVQNDRPAAVREISKRFGNAWVVLKGHQTIIGRSSGKLYVNPSGNPHLAQGGSGDLLGGYLAGLLAQPTLHDNVSQAIRYAVWQHGAAADFLQEKRNGWTIEDLAAELGSVEPNSTPAFS